MKLAAHGISVEVPAGWEGRIFHRSGAAPILHVASFSLHEDDGDFGAAPTGRMRGDDVFAALVAYRPDAQLVPGRGLFAARRPPAPTVLDFSPNQLQVTRRGQLGCQRFFTEAGRPFCLYLVIAPARRPASHLVGRLAQVAQSIRVS